MTRAERTSRLTLLFQAYRNQNGKIRLGDFPLYDSRDTHVGHVDQCELGAGYIRVTGWTVAERVAIEVDGATAATAPRSVRADVVRARGLDPMRKTGFELRLDRVSRGAVLWVHDGVDRRAHPIAPLTRAMSARLALTLMPSFLRDLFRATPAGLRWLRRRDRASARRVLEIMGISDMSAPV